MGHAARKKKGRRRAKLWTLIIALVALAFLTLTREEQATAVPGCCAGHKGVCGCACCDGKPLSQTCRSRMPECGGAAARQGKAGREAKSADAKTIVGQVVRVLDGDTLEVLFEGKPVRIRLAGIDCPEKSQAFGMAAKKLTASLAMGKAVRAVVATTDRYGRTVAEVFLPDGKNLNEEILRAGLAWWYSDYSKDQRLAALEREARAAKRGLWADPDPLPPWVFRRRD